VQSASLGITDRRKPPGSGECFGKDLVGGEGHWHIFLDQPMMANMLTMGSGDGSTGTQTLSLKGVMPGWHTFWVVLVNNDHMPFMTSTGMLVAGMATSVNLYVQSAA
jgi:hypothetical protein